MDTLTLTLPDWSRFDTLVKSELPYALWQVGDQPLLYHWLDYAVNQGATRVIILCYDRPGFVKEYMEKATLWPIKFHIKSVPADYREKDSLWVASLPYSKNPNPTINSEWDLLDHWFFTYKEWFDYVFNDEKSELGTLAIGRFCSIHPTARLRMPIWIGDYVSIGPGCIIGPYASIGEGSILEGPSSIKYAVISQQTYLTGNTELNHAFLIGCMLINLKYKACIENIDPRIANPLERAKDKPILIERFGALFLYFLFRFMALFAKRKERHEWKGINGLNYIEYDGSLWLARRHWLKYVWLGKMRLVGILPRTESQLLELPKEWHNLISKIPPGVYAYSDLHGCHSAENGQEHIHAIYQAIQAANWITWRVLRNIFSIFRKKHISQKHAKDE